MAAERAVIADEESALTAIRPRTAREAAVPRTACRHPIHIQRAPAAHRAMSAGLLHGAVLTARFISSNMALVV